MKEKIIVLLFPITILLLTNLNTIGQNTTITLPEVKKEGGMPLMEALHARQTSRDFQEKDIPEQVLSELLWAAFGVNRENGKRTAPSAMNYQEFDIYVATKNGLFLYQPNNHSLLQIHKMDIRAETGKQNFVKNAPVSLIYVADLKKIKRGSETEKKHLAALDVGFIAQNVYLYCASADLATGVRAYINKEKLAMEMGLADHQEIVLAQSVGYKSK